MKSGLKLKGAKINSKNNIKDLSIKIFNGIYLVTIYLMLLNSIWYFTRLLIFGRKIDIGFLEEFYHIIPLINLIIGFVAISKLKEDKEEKREPKIINYVLKFLLILYSFFSVTAIIHSMYFDFSLSVQPYWDSGEWTF